jgi:hypothetical protein
MTTRAFFRKRVNDHVQYLHHLNQTLEDNRCFEEPTPSDCFKGTSDTNCNLGRWLYGEGLIEITALKNPNIKHIFYTIFEPHTRFHALSKEAIEKRQAGDKQGAQALIAEMTEISEQLTTQLLELEAQLQEEGFF